MVFQYLYYKINLVTKNKKNGLKNFKVKMNNNLRYLNGLIFGCVVNTLQGPNINLPNSYNVNNIIRLASRFYN
jgi:hypothetical protein